MEVNENRGNHTSRKSRSPQSVCKTVRSTSVHQNRCDENVKKPTATTPRMMFAKGEGSSVGFKMELPPKTDESNEKKKGEKNFGFSRRPSTTGGCSSFFRKKSESDDKDWSVSSRITKITSPSQSNSWSERGSVGSNGSVILSTYAKEKKQLSVNKGKNSGKYRVEFSEDVENRPLLSMAVYEQGHITEAVQIAKEEMWKAMIDAKGSKSEKRKSLGGFEPLTPCEGKTRLAAQGGNLLQELNANNLDEVFQVWIHLFYFIINLRINLIRIINVAGTEAFTPNADLERDILTKAIESVSFFSKLKMRSLLESMEDAGSAVDSEIHEREIIDFEKRTLSPFVLEMEFMGKKAKEMLVQLKREAEKKIL